MQVLLTRPAEQSHEVAAALAPDGIDCLIWPLTRIVWSDALPTVASGTNGLIFTSANGVRAMARTSPLRDLPALCVGARTAQAAREAGFSDVRSADGDARALAKLVRQSGLSRLLHVRGADAAGDLAAWVRPAGIEVSEAILYRAEETGAPPADVAAALQGGTVGLLSIWSPRGARILMHRLRELSPPQIPCLAISARAAAPFVQAGLAQPIIAENPSRAAMLTAIRTYFHGNQS